MGHAHRVVAPHLTCTAGLCLRESSPSVWPAPLGLQNSSRQLQLSKRNYALQLPWPMTAQPPRYEGKDGSFVLSSSHYRLMCFLHKQAAGVKAAAVAAEVAIAEGELQAAEGARDESACACFRNASSIWSSLVFLFAPSRKVLIMIGACR